MTILSSHVPHLHNRVADVDPPTVSPVQTSQTFPDIDEPPHPTRYSDRMTYKDRKTNMVYGNCIYKYSAFTSLPLMRAQLPTPRFSLPAIDLTLQPAIKNTTH